MTALYELIAPALDVFLSSESVNKKTSLFCHAAARSAADPGGKKKMSFQSSAFSNDYVADQIKTRLARVQRGIGACALGVRVLTDFEPRQTCAHAVKD